MLRNSLSKHHRGAALQLQRLRAFQAQAPSHPIVPILNTRHFSSGNDPEDEFLLPHKREARRRLLKASTTHTPPSSAQLSQEQSSTTADSQTSEANSSSSLLMSASIVPDSAQVPTRRLEPATPTSIPKPSFTIRKTIDFAQDDFLLPYERAARERLAQKIAQEKRAQEEEAARKAAATARMAASSPITTEPEAPSPAPIKSSPLSSTTPPTSLPNAPVPSSPTSTPKPAFTIRRTTPAEEFLLPHEIAARERIRAIEAAKAAKEAALKEVQQAETQRAEAQRAEAQRAEAQRAEAQRAEAQRAEAQRAQEAQKAREAEEAVAAARRAAAQAANQREVTRVAELRIPAKKLESTPAAPALELSSGKPGFSIRKPAAEETFALPHEIAAQNRLKALEAERNKAQIQTQAPASNSDPDLQTTSTPSAPSKPAFAIRKPSAEEFLIPSSFIPNLKTSTTPQQSTPASSQPTSSRPVIPELSSRPSWATLKSATSSASAAPAKPSFTIRKSNPEDEFLLPYQIAAKERLAKASQPAPPEPDLQARKDYPNMKFQPKFDSELTDRPVKTLRPDLSSIIKAAIPRRTQPSEQQNRIDKFSSLLTNLSQQRQQIDNNKKHNNMKPEGNVWGSLKRRQLRTDQEQSQGRDRHQNQNQWTQRDSGVPMDQRQNDWQRNDHNQNNRMGERPNRDFPEPKPVGIGALGIEVDLEVKDPEPETATPKPKHIADEDFEEEQYSKKAKKKDRKDKKRKDRDVDFDRKGGRASRWDDDPDGAAWTAEDEMRLERKRQEKAARKAAKEAEKLAEKEAAANRVKSIYLPEFISVGALAQPLNVKIDEFLEILLEYGFEDMTEDTIMTGETAALIAQEFGLEAIVDDGHARDVRPRPAPEDPSSLPPRPPVVTIMGHVDHGKTTLLDYLRKSSVAAQEHGGITQHIGAFIVKMQSGKKITFLDTPGHAAFLSMRQRGANATDIVILVVAADDSVMPQTLEALKHARAAKVPIIVAITKADKPEARIEMVKTDLARHEVELEDHGGDIQVVSVSGKTGLGMDALEENILTLAEILDMRAEVDGMAEGWILEANIKPIGKAATVLVKRGTLRVGDSIVAGRTWARIRALRDESGQEIEEAPPGTPVEVLGWRELPQAGDQVIQAPDEGKARMATDYRVEMAEREAGQSQLAAQERKKRELAAEEEARKEKEENGEDLEAVEEEKEKGPKTVNFIIRGDVVGSVEAVSATVLEIGNHEVQSRILRQAAGNISESDVEYAEASGSVIISFNNPSVGHIKRLAADAGVEIVEHSVIYTVADDVKAILSRKLDDKVTLKVIGEAEVRQIFSINLKRRIYKNIAGCKVRNGLIKRNDIVRVMRNNEEVYVGKMSELKQVQRDVMEMKVGTDCGISVEDFEDFQVGDLIQTCEEVRTKRSL